MQLYVIRIASVIVIALIYMLFDILNKRNVPSIFAYATLAYGFILTILYFNVKTIALSTAVSLLILGVGYIVYRIGQLGFADVIEFAALSLILPFFQIPFLIQASQFSIPFAISIAINSGIIAIILVPLYYLPKAMKKTKETNYKLRDQQEHIHYITTCNLLSCIHGVHNRIHRN